MKAGNRRLGIPRKFLALSCSASIVAFLAAGCGGGGSSGPLSRQDFSLSVSPSTISMTVGTISSPVMISVIGQSGFSGAVDVAITGLPHSAVSSPASPLVLSASGTAQALIFIPPTTPTGSLSIEFNATSGSQSHSATLTLTVAPVSDTAVLQEVSGNAAAGMIEIQGVSAGAFNPEYWQENTLNWVPDVHVPMLGSLPGAWQNIYSPWPLEQTNGWRMFYGGWDGTDTPNDRVYSITTSDFLNFNNRTLVIDHGSFEHVNNVNVQQLADGSMYMICTVFPDPYGQDKPGFFFSPDGVTWNSSAEPYSAQLSDIVSIQNDPEYLVSDYNGGNVLLRDNGVWTLFYSTGFFGGYGAVFRATTDSPHVFQSGGSVLFTTHYANDVKKFQIGSTTWYLMALYSEGVTPNTAIWYSLSSDGIHFGQEQTMFSGAYPQDHQLTTPAFAVRGSQVLGALYGAGVVPPCCNSQIFARWLQKKVVITDSSGVQYFTQGGYGPDRQWFQAPASGTLEGTMVVYAEDGMTPLGSSFVTLNGGKPYTLILK
jgi:hypothetical protein